MAFALLGAGARVAMMDIDRESLEESAADARAIGGAEHVLPITGDVSEPEDTEEAVERTIAASMPFPIWPRVSMAFTSPPTPLRIDST